MESPSRGGRPRLLVVDDEDAILLASSDFFAAHGFEVDCARDLQEATRCLEHRAYHGVIADLRLSGSESLEGLEVIDEVRARSLGTRIVVVTAYGSPDIEREARRRGVHAFLHKPVRLGEIERIMTALLESPPGM